MTEKNKKNPTPKPDKQNKSYENRTMKKNIPEKGKRTPPGQK